MNTSKLHLFALIAYFTANLAIEARHITLIVSGSSGASRTSEAIIASGEIAELVGCSGWPTSSPHSRPYLISAIKDSIELNLDVPPFHSASSYPGIRPPTHVIVGPAVIRITINDQVYPIGNQPPAFYCTFKITPEAFPPDRTILVPPGNNQSRITLECSTNLVDWSEATNGVYGPLPEAKFFRIKLEHIPQ